MQAIELEAQINDHRLDIRSDRLPRQGAAKVIVLYDRTDAAAAQDILALARAAQASFPRKAPEDLSEEMRQLRDEWERPL